MNKFRKSVSTHLRKFRLRALPEFNLLILGLNNSGKSTLAGRLCMKNEETLKNINPTVQPNEMDLKYKTMKVHMRDLSGQWRMRQSWHTFFPNTNALIFVVDSTDVSRLAEARCELCDVLLDERMSQVPLLVLANKQDVYGALPSSMIIDFMGLNRLEGRAWNIQECSTLTGAGSFSTIEWIYKSLKKQRPQSRIQKILNPTFLFSQMCPLDCRRPAVDV
ncbi:ADP-ribosylation factor-like protein 3 isoform X1 [Drosophila sulfurigaster albostrigata]|uniref:ADP-ribosylation factor-like protein 3 isoform X1 n=1 Tax=Drosophila sulfurigaster albostrigata TaxID=89887 RepID=UPI002D2194E3|nr:ADP-ribosylation factor-like protein 3 isoform X1 [Drosophila sulfurigaster albostrigata]